MEQQDCLWFVILMDTFSTEWPSSDLPSKQGEVRQVCRAFMRKSLAMPYVR